MASCDSTDCIVASFCMCNYTVCYAVASGSFIMWYFGIYVYIYVTYSQGVQNSFDVICVRFIRNTV